MLAGIFLEYEHNLGVAGDFYNSFKYNDYLGGLDDASFEKQERVDQSQSRTRVCKHTVKGLSFDRGFIFSFVLFVNLFVENSFFF